MCIRDRTAVLKFFAPNKQKEETTKESSSSSSSMSYKRAYNSETGLREVVEGSQGEGISMEAANQHNYENQIKMLEAKKSMAPKRIFTNKFFIEPPLLLGLAVQACLQFLIC